MIPLLMPATLKDTTLDPKMQQAANVAVRNGLFGYEERHGYRGPVAKAVTPPPGEDGEPVLDAPGGTPTGAQTLISSNGTDGFLTVSLVIKL